MLYIFHFFTSLNVNFFFLDLPLGSGWVGSDRVIDLDFPKL
jgi:hypothetical protein